MPISKSLHSLRFPLLGLLLGGALWVWLTAEDDPVPAIAEPKVKTGATNDNNYEFVSARQGTQQSPRKPELDESTAAWMSDLIESEPYPESLSIAIEELHGVPGKQALLLLERTLGDPDFDVSMQAIEAIAQHRNAGVYVLGRVLLGEKRGELRQKALTLLADIPGPASTSMLRQAAQNDPLAHVREQAKRLLANRPPDLVEPTLDDRPSQSEAYELIEQTWQMPIEEASEQLGEVLAVSPDSEVRRRSIEELARIADTSAIAPLSQGLRDPQPELRSEALYALSAYGQHSVHLLGQAMIADPDPFVRETAARLLAKDAGPAARAILQNALHDEDPGIRRLARNLLAQ